MKQQLSSKQEEFSELVFPKLHSSNEQEGPSEPTEPTFVDDDEPLSLEDTAFVTRGHLPEDLYRKFRDMRLILPLKEDSNADNR